MQNNICGIILAAGKGARMKTKDKNKTSLDFNGKPMVAYAVEVMQKVADETMVVVGSAAGSVVESLKEYKVRFAIQKKRLGTGHAAKVAVDQVKKENLIPKVVLIGYGDHMMFYSPEVLQKLVDEHFSQNAVLSMLSTEYDDPMKLAWGRILRDESGNVLRIVEQKDASEVELKVKEINPGFYCFNYDFVDEYVYKIKPSPVTGEYYITDLIEFAFKSGSKVCAVKVPFEKVGIGVNTPQQLEESEKLYQQVHKK
ncbi:MAG: sugar phosphate nucleotidyltransferase [Patescibacteria group bacterium]|jgi:bifunctional UDP-N-acetylglucosamine pyrophosphorylase/glucosamine-1-phosphate N-acetyltransferase